MTARTEKIATFYFLRQQMQKPAGQFNHCLADFVAPADRDQSRRLQDYLGGFAVSIHGADELAEEFKREHDDYNAIMTKALADRLAEAFAEYLHKEARIAWGLGATNNCRTPISSAKNIAASGPRRVIQPARSRGETNALRFA